MQEDERPFEEGELDGLEEIPMNVRLAKSHALTITFSDVELRLLAHRARDHGVSVSAFIREAAVERAQQRARDQAASTLVRVS